MTPQDNAATGTGDADVQDAAAAAPATTPSRRRTLILLSIAATIVLLDIVTKIIVVATIQPGENVRVLGGLVYLTQIRNAGAAFSMATGMTWLLAIIAAAVVAFIIRMAPKLQSTPWAVCLGLILGGAVGNLIDRIFRAPGVMQGHVVDFVSVFAPNAEVFPAFNAADSGITIGGVLLVLLAVLGYDYDGTRHRKGVDPGAATGSSKAAATDSSDASANGSDADDGNAPAAAPATSITGATATSEPHPRAGDGPDDESTAGRDARGTHG